MKRPTNILFFQPDETIYGIVLFNKYLEHYANLRRFKALNEVSYVLCDHYRKVMHLYNIFTLN